MSYSLKELRNSKLFSGLVVYRYLCETWKRERPHTVNPITGYSLLKFKSDSILFKIERSRWFDEYVAPHRELTNRRKYMKVYDKVKKMSYVELTRTYKVTMNPILNTLQK